MRDTKLKRIELEEIKFVMNGFGPGECGRNCLLVLKIKYEQCFQKRKWRKTFEAWNHDNQKVEIP
jgi:hypothetical protein